MDCGGTFTISAYERERLGWIRCDVLQSDRDSVRLGDLYTSSMCIKVPFGAGRGRRTLYLSHHQRIGFFDRYRRGGDHGQFELGLLRTTGLLVMVADGRRVDVLPADGTLDLSVDNAGYEGDLYGPNTRQQLTPWTRPNSNGFSHYPPDYRPAWQALDRIRYDDERHGELVFDFIEDFRTRPDLREDSWIGPETEGYRFDAPLRVLNGSTLKIETELTVAGGLSLAPGTRLHLAAGSRLTVSRGAVLAVGDEAELVVEGTLILDGSFERSAGSRVSTLGSGRILQR
jgi:hypothetical protein